MPIIGKAERKTEAALEAAIIERHPRILGALLDAVAGILAHPEERPKDLPRMADFAVWMARARPALGWHETLFATAYDANREGAVASIIDDDVLGQAIVALLDSLPGGTWTGTATELLAALPEATRRERDFPSRNRLGAALNRLRTALDAEGIDVKLPKPQGKKRDRNLTLTRRPS